jgi:threonine dehydrogenase-like Zn-dependent dehydrogenase
MPDRIARLTAPRTSEISRQAIRTPGAGQVSVEVLACGVCASESHAWEGPLAEYPVALGHEPVGIVEALGRGVTRVTVGDRVTGRAGPAFADHLIADEHDLVAVPPGLSLADSIGEPLGCVVEALRRTRVGSGDAVAVVGTGYMGLLMCDLLRIGDAGRVVAIDPREDARAAALELGADEAVEPGDSRIDDLGGSIDVAIEATGTQAGLDIATDLVREHGVLSILGFHQGNRRSVALETWNWKAIDVVNAHVRRRDLLDDAIRRGLELARSGRIRPGRLVTHRFHLEELDRAFEALASKPRGFIKAIVVNEDG